LPVPSGESSQPASERVYVVALLAVVENEKDWSKIAPVITSYARALTAHDDVVLALAATGEIDAATLGRRIERALEKAEVAATDSPDIDVSDVVGDAGIPAWRARFADARQYAVAPAAFLDDVEPLLDRSRSGLTRFVRGLVQS
jgi:hypothetical protein